MSNHANSSRRRVRLTAICFAALMITSMVATTVLFTGSVAADTSDIEIENATLEVNGANGGLDETDIGEIDQQVGGSDGSTDRTVDDSITVSTNETVTLVVNFINNGDTTQDVDLDIGTDGITFYEGDFPFGPSGIDPDGPENVTVGPDGETAEFDLQFTESFETPVDISVRLTDEHTDWKLAGTVWIIDDPGSIEGTVTNETGDPITDATVIIEPRLDEMTDVPNERDIITADTNESGQYEREVLPGTYNIGVTTDERRMQPVRVIDVDSDQTLTQDFTLYPVDLRVDLNRTVTDTETPVRISGNLSNTGSNEALMVLVESQGGRDETVVVTPDGLDSPFVFEQNDTVEFSVQSNTPAPRGSYNLRVTLLGIDDVAALEGAIDDEGQVNETAIAGALGEIVTAVYQEDIGTVEVVDDLADVEETVELDNNGRAEFTSGNLLAVAFENESLSGEVTAAEFDGLVGGSPDPPSNETVVGPVFTIDVPAEATNEPATLTATVSDEQFDGVEINETTSEELVVLRAVETETSSDWTFLPTSVTNGGSNEYEIEAETPGFSTFAVAYVPADDPVAAFEVIPEQPVVDLPAEFRARDSTTALPGYVSFETFEWNVSHEDEDSETFENSSAITEYTFDRTGNYTVSLTVTDDRGLTNVTERNLTVIEDPADYRVAPTDSLRDVVNSAGAGEMVYVEEGVHDVSETMLITNESVTVRADPMAEKRPILNMTRPDSDSIYGLEIRAGNVTIEGLRFTEGHTHIAIGDTTRDRRWAGDSRIGNAFTANDAVITDNEFDNSDRSVSVNPNRRVSIDGNTFTDTTNAIQFRNVQTQRWSPDGDENEYARSSGTSITNNTASGGGVFIDNSNAFGTEITHNTITDVRTGISVGRYATRTTIENNTITAAEANGISIRRSVFGLGSTGHRFDPERTFTITDNEITGTTGDGNGYFIDSVGNGIVVEGQQRAGATIENNNLENNARSGVNLGPSGTATFNAPVMRGGAYTITNNTVLGNGYAGIEMQMRVPDGRSTFITVTDNTVEDNDEYSLLKDVRFRGAYQTFYWYESTYTGNTFVGSEHGVEIRTDDAIRWTETIDGETTSVVPLEEEGYEPQDFTEIGPVMLGQAPAPNIEFFNPGGAIRLDRGTPSNMSGNYWGSPWGPTVDGELDPLQEVGLATPDDDVDSGERVRGGLFIDDFAQDRSEVGASAAERATFSGSLNEAESTLNVSEGENAIVAVDVTNVGNAPGNETVGVTVTDTRRFGQLDDLFQSETVTVEPDDIRTVSFEIETDERFQRPLVEATVGNTVAEAELNVSLEADLELLAVGVSEQAVAPGDELEVDVLLRNNGGASTEPKINLYVYESGADPNSAVTTETSREMAANRMTLTTLTYEIPDGADDGTYVIAIDVDEMDDVGSSDVQRSITVVEPLSIENLEITHADGDEVDDPGNVSASESVTFGAELPPESTSSVEAFVRAEGVQYISDSQPVTDLGDGSWEATIDLDGTVVPDDGEYLIALEAENVEGVTTSEGTDSFLVNREAPTFSAAITDVDTGNATLRVRSSEPIVEEPTVTVDTPGDDTQDIGMKGQSDTEWTGTFGLDGSGEYVVAVEGTDLAGNEGNASMSTNIDTDLTITSDGVELNTSDGTVVVFYAEDDNIEDVYAAIAANANEDEELEPDQVGFNFLTANLAEDLADDLSHAEIWLPADDDAISDEMSLEDINITRFNTTDDEWEDPLDTDYHDSDSVDPETDSYPETLNGSLGYWNATVETFSTYGSLGTDTTPPTVTGVTPRNGTEVDWEDSIPVTFEYEDDGSGINTSSVSFNATVFDLASGETDDVDLSDTSVTGTSATATVDVKPRQTATVNLTVADNAGNEAMNETSFTVSTEDAGPKITAVDPTDGDELPHDTDEIVFEFTYEERGWSVPPARADQSDTPGVFLTVDGSPVTNESKLGIDGDSNTVTYEFEPESQDQVTAELHVTDDSVFTTNKTVTVDFASPPESGDDSESAGGSTSSSGSSSGSTEPETDDEAAEVIAPESAERASIEPDAQTGGSVVTFSDLSSIETITFGEVASGEVTVSDLQAPPESTGNPPGTFVSATQIIVPEMLRNSQATITTGVSVDRLEELETTPEALSFNRFNADTDEWEPLETTVIESTDDRVMIAAETPGFSVFAISAVALEPDASVDDIDTEQSSSDEETPSSNPPQSSDDTEPESTAIEDQPGFGVIAALFALFLTIVARWKGSKT